MNLFLADRVKEYSYNDLLDKINSSTEYYPLLKTNNLFNYFSNLILALISNRSLVLLDSDVNSEDCLNIKGEDINKAETLPQLDCVNLDVLIDKLQNSASDITIFTSGTTGQPQKVIHSVKTLTRAVRIGTDYESQVWGFAYNPTHMAGLQVFFQAFENKNTLVNIFNFSRSEIYNIILKYNISHISATPTFYRLLLPYEQSYPSVLRVTLGGEKSTPKLYDAIMKIFPNARINNIYASTEGGSLLAAKGDSFQIPSLIADKFKVEDDELLIHKSLLGKSDNFLLDGDYYRSGDLIEWVDKTNGLFRFKSRKNELVNVGGYKVSPNEVETFIMQIEGIQQAIVYGKPNSVLGNILCTEIKMEPDHTITESEVRQFLTTKLQDFKIPRKIIFVESFSLTRTGKIKRL